MKHQKNRMELASIRMLSEELLERLERLDIEKFQGQSLDALKLLLESLSLAIQSYESDNINITIHA